jgi:hypothetical protein
LASGFLLRFSRAASLIPNCARPLQSLLRKEWPRLSFTARIGRAQFHRARSASKKDGLAAPYPFLPSLFLPFSYGVAWISPQLRTSNDYYYGPSKLARSLLGMGAD